jgi:hypothetical protein
MFVRSILLAGLLLSIGSAPAQRTFIVDCTADGVSASSNGASAQHSLAELNTLTLHAGDRVLFERGTICRGSVHPGGAGFSIAATGTGPLPLIQAGPADEAALSLFNADHVRIESLDLRGGTTYGIHISGDKPIMQGIVLHNLTVSGVHGKLEKKGSGLVVISPAGEHARFADVDIDGVRAFDTTQWSGIFVDGATHVTIQNSVVHDVQGDGIVIFESQDGRIAHSVAWHTGMQLTQSIGTPNAIWTWRCTRCIVEDNEAFLTDSPGIDGGAFDIDWGNTSNAVRSNFGHDTQGYCVSIFAAHGPTVHSVVEGNLCLNNGRSPRLAREQGALLISTWSGGSLEDVQITKNRIDWRPDGDTPAVQTFPGTSATGVHLDENEIHSTGTVLISKLLPYTGDNNHYVIEGAAAPAENNDLSLYERNSTLVHGAEPNPWQFPQRSATGWRLIVHLTEQDSDETVQQLFVRLSTAVVEYGPADLALTVDAPPDAVQRFHDFGLATEAEKAALPPHAGRNAMLELVSPDGRIAESWNTPPGAIDFGLALRRQIGSPSYGRLPFGSAEETK